jgi:hypothetical protein
MVVVAMDGRQMHTLPQSQSKKHGKPREGPGQTLKNRVCRRCEVGHAAGVKIQGISS